MRVKQRSLNLFESKLDSVVFNEMSHRLVVTSRALSSGGDIHVW